MNASINDTNAEAICAAGGIAPLVALLEAGADSVAATYAAGALMNQAFHASSAEAIRAAGGIAPLVALLGAGADSEAASYAVNAIMNLAASTISAEAIREARIEQYEKEVLQAAERAVAHAVPPERAGASSSSEPPAKRTRGRGQR